MKPLRRFLELAENERSHAMLLENYKPAKVHVVQDGFMPRVKVLSYKIFTKLIGYRVPLSLVTPALTSLSYSALLNLVSVSSNFMPSSSLSPMNIEAVKTPPVGKYLLLSTSLTWIPI